MSQPTPEQIKAEWNAVGQIERALKALPEDRRPVVVQLVKERADWWLERPEGVGAGA